VDWLIGDGGSMSFVGKADIASHTGVCTENLGPDVMVMKSTKNRV
jgi:hypothetical protein